MDEELDNTLAPLVDALTGAMAAVLLISIFMMLNTMSDVASSIKEYGQQALSENQKKIDDLFGRKPPELQLKNKKIFFFKSFKMLNDQKISLIEYFKNYQPKKITLYSDETKNISTFNLLTFIVEVELDSKIDQIKIEVQPAKEKGFSELVWE